MCYFCEVNIHEKYIKRCIELAKNGLGKTYPNPMVGSVVVLNDKIIGEGWHQKAGASHAEVNAIHAVKDRRLLKKATIYVSLEPCAHYGKTPPCAHLIVESGIKSVVIGTVDTHSKVCGKGISYLKENHCNVQVGFLEDECKLLNKHFFSYHNKKRPFIVLKWAETADGFIDKVRNENDKKEPHWISNQYSQQKVHQMRTQIQAILVGTHTALNDNPKLNVRTWKGNNPTRVVLDRNLVIPAHYHLLDDTVKTIVLTEKGDPSTYKNTIFEQIDFSKNVPQQMCTVLYKHQIQSLLVEGGKQTLQSFIDDGLWDEAFVFVGNILFKEGLNAPVLKKAPYKSQKIVGDVLKRYCNN